MRRGGPLQRREPMRRQTSPLPARKSRVSPASPRPAQTRRDTGPSPKLRADVYERDGHRCQCCGKAGQLTIQHRDPRGMGGTSDPAINRPSLLVTMCGSGTTGCHGRAEHSRRWSTSQGWHVPPGTDPETWPICRYDGEWVFLLDDLTIRYQETPDV